MRKDSYRKLPLNDSICGLSDIIICEESTDNVVVEGYQIFRDDVYITSSIANSYEDAGLTEVGIYSYLVKRLFPR